MQEHVNWGGEGFSGTDSPKQAEVCKPDYERLIAERKLTLKITENMFDATRAFIQHIGSGSRTNPLKDLLGHLLINQYRLQEQIASFIAEQEKDNTKDQG